MQFLSTGSNRRTDGYGGGVHNRIRFVVEALEAMAAAAGDASRDGIKISPAMPFNDIQDDDPIETYTTLVKAIAPMGLAYLHVLRTPPLPTIFEILRPLFFGPFAAGGARSTSDPAMRCWNRVAPTSSFSVSCSRRIPICLSDSRWERR